MKPEITHQLADAARALLGHRTQTQLYNAEQAAREALAAFDAERVAPAFTDAEVSTLLAALRFWQLHLTGEAPDDDFDHIADRGGTLVPLDAAAIDDLCDYINFGA